MALAWLLGVSVAGRAQTTTFSFSLDEPCKTSAGVYRPDGTLVRTLWSKVRYGAAGTYSAVWDGLDDNSNPAPAGVYQIRLLQHNTEYVWDGAIGNTSAELSGPTVHTGFWPMRDMAIAGTNAFYVSGYNEGKYDFRYFATTDPQRVKKTWGPGNNPGNIYDRNWNWTATDGKWVYFACNAATDPTNGLASTYPGFVTAFNVSDDSHANFTNGVQIPNGPGPNDIYSGIYVGTQPGLSGLAVQQSGNLLAASVAPDNRVYLLNKNTGAAAGNIGVNSPERLSFSPDGSLWVISSNKVICFTNLNVSPAVALTISNFSEPLAVAVNPMNAGIILVADGGSSQQVKAFNGAGTSLWTYGLAGGYQTNGVAVATNKFWFFDGENDGTFLCFSSDGSFWVGDGGNYRSLHFSAAGNYIEQIMHQPHSWIACVDQNDPSRVFNQFLEFKVDYTKPLPQAWTLVNNWKVNVPAANISWNEGLIEVTTFTNGRTYALVDYNQSGNTTKELCELGTNQLRLTGIFPMATNVNRWISLGPDGSARATTMNVASWHESTLRGFDTNNNPVWNPETLIAAASNGSSDPVPRCCSFGNIRATISSNNVLISLDQSLNNGWHLGGIRLGATNWLWKASPAGDLNGMGNYEIANGVQYGGDTLQAVDRQVIYGYHGEYFRGQGEASQLMHYYDDGLFVGEFGEASPGHSAYEGALPGFAGNGHCPSLTKTASGDYYVWVNDESAHGPQRWHLVNARNIREQTGSGALGSSMTLTNQPVSFPTGVAGFPANQSADISWLPVTNATSYNIYYSLMNGGPYGTLAARTNGTNCVVGGLANGQTCYFAVAAVIAGTEGMPSEQVAIRPFDTSQTVLGEGKMDEGSQWIPAIDVSSTAAAAGQPAYLGEEHLSSRLNLREVDDYGYGSLMNENMGSHGYALYSWGGTGSNLINILPPFTVTVGSGWAPVDNLERACRVDNVFGANKGGIANLVGSINIGVSDTNFHFLTVVSPAEFNNPRKFVLTLASTNNTSASYTVNENPGYSHFFQFLFKGNVTLTADATGGAGAIVQDLFLDNAPVTFLPASSPSTNLSLTTLSSSPNPAPSGSVVTLTATVSGSGGMPTGMVTFQDGSTSLGTGTVNSSGVATLSTSGLSVGGSPHAITAVYGGDTVFGGSTSSALFQIITNTVTSTNSNPSYTECTNWLVAWYPLAGDANDHWGVNNGTLHGGSSYGNGLDDSPNGSLAFDGISQFVSANDATLPLGTNARTISAWVLLSKNPDPTKAYQMVSYGATATCQANGIGIQVTGGGQQQITFFGWGNDTTVNSALIPQTWYNIAGTFDGTTSIIYLNGAPLITNNVPWNTVSGGNFYIGRLIGNNNYHYGSVCDVRIYSTNLTAAQLMTNILAVNLATNVPMPDLMDLTMLDDINVSPTGSYTNWPAPLFDASALRNTNIIYYDNQGATDNSVWMTNRAGIVNSAVHWHGVAGSFIDTHEVSHFNFTTNNFSYSFWARPYGVNAMVCCNGIYKINGWYVEVSPFNQIVFGTEANNTDFCVASAGSSVGSTFWAHCCITVSAMTNARIYINGVLSGSGSVTCPAPATHTLQFGQSPANSGYTTPNLDGDLWLPQMWSTALSPADVGLLYKNQLSGHPWPAVATNRAPPQVTGLHVVNP